MKKAASTARGPRAPAGLSSRRAQQYGFTPLLALPLIINGENNNQACRK